LTRIALDAMGGDRAPEATVAGAVQAARRLGIPVLLVGNRPQLEAELGRHSPPRDLLEIMPAEDSIGMDEAPGPALLRKRNASIVVAMDLVKQGRASGVVSAGNSGAVMGAAVIRLGLLPGVDRPAIAMLLPTRRAPVVVLDAGATVDCRPEHLRDFARMGSIYAQSLLRIKRPRVGLLNIGHEPSKGNTLAKQAHDLLQQLPINFVGNVEGQQIAQGDVDVAVCDGFVGNTILKATEGYAELFWSLMRERLTNTWRGRLAAWLLRSGLYSLARQLDYASYGGALLVGVNGVCVVAHGRSNPAAVENAIRVAKELAEQGVVEELAFSFQQASAPAADPAAAQAPHT